MCIYNAYILFSEQDLDQTAKTLVHSSIRPSTRKVYDSAQNSYLSFCTQYGFLPFPPEERILLLYVAFLFRKNNRAATIKVYMSAVRFMAIENHFNYQVFDSPRIKMAIRSVEIGQLPPKQKLPITLNILQRFYEVMSVKFSDYTCLLMWTSMCVAHFACLRSGEFTVKNSTMFDKNCNLTVDDVRKLDPTKKCYVLNLKHSKTDKSNRGVQIVLACNGQKVCPYCSLEMYLKVRSESEVAQSPDSPLFLLPGGAPLTRNVLINNLRIYLASIGIPPDNYSGHSFRAGGATSAALSGLKDWEIKHIGRWKSEAYQKYIRPSLSQIYNLSVKRSNNQ